MKSLLAIITFFSLPSCFAQSKLDSAIASITEKTVLVRVGADSCKDFAPVSALAGGALELEYENFIAGLDRKDLTTAAWKNLSARDCVKDCTCYALSRLYDAYDDNTKKSISKEAIEKKLNAMTDQNYRACMQNQKDLCTRPSVQEFIKTLAVPKE